VAGDRGALDPGGDHASERRLHRRKARAKEGSRILVFDQCEEAQVDRDIAAASTVAWLTTQAKSEEVRGRMAIWRLTHRYEEYVPLQRSVIDAQMTGGEPEPIKMIIGLDPDVLTREVPE
jgi:hypothetical protein